MIRIHDTQRRQSTPVISWRTDMCHSHWANGCTVDQNSVWSQEFCCGSSGIAYQLHCMTLTVFTASKSSWKRICLVAAVAHSDYVFCALQILLLTYLLTHVHVTAPYKLSHYYTMCTYTQQQHTATLLYLTVLMTARICHMVFALLNRLWTGKAHVLQVSK